MGPDLPGDGAQSSACLAAISYLSTLGPEDNSLSFRFSKMQIENHWSIQTIPFYNEKTDP